MTAIEKVALVVGAQGVIGRNLVDYLASLGDWEIVGLSRRGGESTGRVRHVSVDLLDLDDCRRKLSELTRVTHIFYAAYQERPTWAELVPLILDGSLRTDGIFTHELSLDDAADAYAAVAARSAECVKVLMRP